MSRFLFVVPPLTGHINPAGGVAAELSARGHQTAWAGKPSLIERLVGPAAKVFPCAAPEPGGAGSQRGREIRGLRAVKYLWEDFLIPLADAMAPGIEDAVAHFRPDVLVVDQQALAGALTAERLGLPWATLATTSAEFTGSTQVMPRVDSWIREELAQLRARIGDASNCADPRFSPSLNLVCTTQELTGPLRAVSGPTEFIGPTVPGSRPGPPFPWTWLDPDRATVLVTLGTANADIGARFLAVCRDALRLRARRLQAVIVDSRAVPEENPPEADADVLVLPRVPQLDLLPHTTAVVCHSGHNTVCEALLHGIPLVVAPIRDDQPIVAGQVITAGAGLRVRFERATATQVGDALDAVINQSHYRDAARRIGASFRAAGGASAAAASLERLAES